MHLELMNKLCFEQKCIVSLLTRSKLFPAMGRHSSELCFFSLQTPCSLIVAVAVFKQEMHVGVNMWGLGLGSERCRDSIEVISVCSYPT